MRLITILLLLYPNFAMAIQKCSVYTNTQIGNKKTSQTYSVGEAIVIDLVDVKGVFTLSDPVDMNLDAKGREALRKDYRSHSSSTLNCVINKAELVFYLGSWQHRNGTWRNDAVSYSVHSIDNPNDHVGMIATCLVV